MFIDFEKPRHWRIRIYGPMLPEKARFRHHVSLGVVANNAHTAIKKVEKEYPDYRLECCVDTGEIHFIAT